MRLIQVTLGSGATPIISGTAPVDTAPTPNGVTIQNNAAHNCAYGDSSVTLTTGIVLSSGNPGGSGTMFGKIDLTQVYIVGTQNDVITVLAF